MRSLALLSTFILSLVCWHRPAFADELAGARAKTYAEALKANSEGHRLDLTAPSEMHKLEAETTKLYTEAYRTISETYLNYVRAEQAYLDMARLRQRMRITDYEFNRIVRGDYKMEQEIGIVERNVQLVRPLVLGHADWRTWIGLEALMVSTGDADILTKVMFEIPVPALPSSEFRTASAIDIPLGFPGGNLGELYSFAREQDLAFKPYGLAHKSIMKIVAMISAASEMRIRELRDINQALRLTIARID